MVRTRFAPSPTGSLHPGNLRTALFNALYAAREGGRFVLRIEDTDASRSAGEHAEALLTDLRWLGLEWDEGPGVEGPAGPYRQSERAAIHVEYLERLHAEGVAYPCFCSAAELAAQRARARAEGRPPRYPGTCAAIPPDEAQRRLDAGEPAALRFRVPAGRELIFDDLVHGEQRVNAEGIGDFVIRRADGSAAFFFANALDDALMEVTHVLRGEDHLANTARQLVVLEALALTAPRYGHLPLVVDGAGAPLSKRERSVGLARLRDSGVLPEALCNYLLRLGHSVSNRNLLGFAEMAAVFDPARLGRAPARYDPGQLAHWQKLAVHALDAGRARDWAAPNDVPEERWPDFWRLVSDNVADRADVAGWADSLRALPPARLFEDASPELLEMALALCHEPDYETFVSALGARTGLGGRALYQPLRAALTGRHDGPELARVWAYFKLEERHERFRHAYEARVKPPAELRIYNSLTRDKAPFESLEPGRVGLYVCGVTAYDDAHLGHARMLVVFDMVVRYMRARGLRVTYVRNITDIDDKIIRRAAENDEDWQALVERYVERVGEDERALGLIRPDFEPRATQNLSAIIAVILRLIEKRHAYVADNGDVYYSVATFPDYGELAGQRPEDMRVGARIEPDEAKHDALDFALWKAAKPGEPAWNSPWGRGRPGWHIECSAMSMANLGRHFDIHGGGLDLKFPHHQNEIAQSEGMTGERFANLWMHNGFVEVGEEKMAKSLGNFTTIRDLLGRWPGETLRYFILTSHYRSPLSYTEARIEEAHAALSRLYLSLRGVDGAPQGSAEGAPPPGYAERFHEAMSDDFNTPEALAVLHELAREINRRREGREGVAALAAELRGLARPLGLLQADADEFLRRGGAASGLGAEDIEALIEERRGARGDRNFERADAIRDRLAEAGIVLEDTPGGTLWRRA